MSCVKISNERAAKYLKDEFLQDETKASIENAIGLYWERYPDRYEEYPSANELGGFISDLRAEEGERMLREALLPSSEIASSSEGGSFDNIPVSSLSEQRAVDLVFDPRVRRDRVTLISRLFSNEVDAALKEKQDEINIRMMSEDLSEKGRESLRQELYSLDRFQIIKELRPGGVFNRVRGIFQEYVDDSDEGRVQAELNKINASEQSLIDEGVIDESERFSNEEKLEAAKKKAAYKLQEYQKILDHFDTLAEEASGLLLMTEGIRVDPNYETPSA